jgi:hypothetical protein
MHVRVVSRGVRVRQMPNATLCSKIDLYENSCDVCVYGSRTRPAKNIWWRPSGLLHSQIAQQNASAGRLRAGAAQSRRYHGPDVVPQSRGARLSGQPRRLSKSARSHMVHVPGAPTLVSNARAQFRAGRAKLLDMKCRSFMKLRAAWSAKTLALSECSTKNSMPLAIRACSAPVAENSVSMPRNSES